MTEAPAADEIVVNGERRALAGRPTLAEFLADLGHDPRTVAVELNARILPRRLFATTRLQAGDRLEIVRFVQGG